MNRFLLFFVLSITPLFSENQENPLSNFDGEPSMYVNNVNVISCSYCEAPVDMVVPGPEPLVIQRFYHRPYGGDSSGYFNFNFYYSLEEDWEVQPRNYGDKVLKLQTGVGCHYFEGSQKQDTGKIPLVIKGSKGFTNCAEGEISARSNPKNIRLEFSKDSSTKKTINKIIYGSGKSQEFSGEMLKTERRPSGNQLTHIRASENLKISLLNSENTLSFLTIGDFVKINKKHYTRTFTTCDGRSVGYIYKSGESRGVDRHVLVEVKPSDGPLVKYTWEKYCTNVHLKRKELPDNRFFELDRDEKGLIIKEPVGNDETPIVTNRFERCKNQEGKDFTRVYDAYNNTTDFVYNNDERLIEIIRREGSNTVLNQEKFYWGRSETNDEGNLVSRSVFSKLGKPLMCRDLKYDERGNVLKERLFGCLTGTNPINPAIGNDGYALENGCDVYEKTYTYSDDGLNLPLSEADFRQTITYEYYQGKNLLKTKFIKAEGQIKIRHFYTYDNNGILTKEITDNGSDCNQENLSGVTERHIKNVRNTTTTPVGFPEEIEERYLDLTTGVEMVLSRVVNTFSLTGNLTEQQCFDSENCYRYSLKWEYDRMGNVNKEVDALGQTILRLYDSNGNLKIEEGPRHDYHKEFRYDFSNRLIACEEVHHTGQRLTTTNQYNYLGHKISSTDVHGNKTKYKYDAAGRVISVELPIVYSEGLFTKSMSFTEYDAIGNPICKSDSRGNRTEASYTIHGKAFRIQYPDQTVEENEYSLDGQLIRSIGKNGLVTLYDYDYQLRLTKKVCLDSHGAQISCMTRKYDAYHLIEETNANGVTTYFSYDDAGRLVLEEKPYHLIDYEYDRLGRLYKTTTTNGDQTFTRAVNYDLLNRVTEEWDEVQGEITSKTHYVYDQVGNKIQTLVETKSGSSLIQISYNSENKPLEIMDAEGQITRFVYNHKFLNEFHQTVLCTQITDPLGNIREEICDPIGRVTCTQHKNSHGIVIQKEQMFYTQSGQKSKSTQTIFTPNQPERKIFIKWNYDQYFRLQSITEAFNTRDQKTTSFGYNSAGQIEVVEKPGGLRLFSTYDDSGQLGRYRSSDNTIALSYKYDPCGNLIEIFDEIENASTIRQYDQSDRVVYEKLSNGLEMNYKFDDLGKISQVTLHDQSAIQYTYEGLNFAKIKRIHRDGYEMYQHEYVEYDDKKPLKVKLAMNAGVVEYDYDKLGRCKLVEHKKWKERVPANGMDLAGNLLKTDQTDALGSVSKAFSYDDLYQIKSESGAESHDYLFDSGHNRLSMDGSQSRINNLNQLLQESDRKYLYDDRGNLIEYQDSQKHLKFDYDALDRLSHVDTPTQHLWYKYDGFNRRVAKHVTENNRTAVIRYIYQGDHEIGCCDESDKIYQLRVLGLGKVADIGAAVAFELGDEVFVPIHDRNGNVCTLLDKNGDVFETYRYTAFGQEKVYNYNGEVLEGSFNPWRFSSKRVDEETGFSNFGRRFYDPKISRWITKDPKGYNAGPNLYAYVMNNPMTRLDPYGLDWTREGDTWVRNRPNHDRAPGEPMSRGRSEPSRREGSIGGKTAELAVKQKESPVVRVARSRSHNFDVGVFFNEKGSVVMVCGIYTTKDDQFDRSLALSKSLDNMIVSAAYCQTHGPLDILQHFIVDKHIPTHAVEVCVQNLRNQIASLGGVASGATIFAIAHSNGATILYHAMEQLTTSERNMIEAYTLGGATMIPNNFCKRAINYINRGDLVSLGGDLLGNFRMCFNKSYATVVVLDSHENFPACHRYDSVGYQLAMDFISNDIRNKLKM